MIRVYLDNSVLNRPFDDQSIPKIQVETAAILSIFEFIDKNKIKLISSSVIEYENSRNPFFDRKIWVAAYLSKASLYQKMSIAIAKRAQEIKELGIPAIDSLHLASAEAAKVDYFLTCDYGILKKYRGKLHVANPVDFIQIFQSK